MFLTIYTPTYKRPVAFAKCAASVRAQTCKDYEHVIYRDEIGDGITGMFARLVGTVFDADYIYILQDDDWLSDKNVVSDLRDYAEANDSPPVIICKSRKHRLHLPLVWGGEPAENTIDLGNYVVRRDVFDAHKEGLLTGRYQADYDFIRLIWDDGIVFNWYPRLICESDQFGQGKPE